MNKNNKVNKDLEGNRGYHVLINSKVIMDLKSIHLTPKVEIINAIKLIKYVKRPFMGKKIVDKLSQYYKHRVGDYVILYRFSKDKNAIVIIKIKQRISNGLDVLLS